MRTLLKRLQIACLFLCASLTFAQANPEAVLEDGTYTIGLQGLDAFLTTDTQIDFTPFSFAPKNDLNISQQWNFIHVGNGEYTISSNGTIPRFFTWSGDCQAGTGAIQDFSRTSGGSDLTADQNWLVRKANGGLVISPANCASQAFSTTNLSFLRTEAFVENDPEFIFNVALFETAPDVGQLLADGVYRIQSNQNGTRLQSTGSSFEVTEATANAFARQPQRWRFEHLGDNVYTISNPNTGNRLEVPNAATENGTIVAVTNFAGQGDNLRWKLTNQSGAFVLSPAHDLSKALDIRPGDRNVQIYSIAPNNINQQWSLIPFTFFSRKIASENKQNTEIVVSPNPANDYINISGVNKDDALRIYDMQGRLVSNTIVKVLNTNQMTYNINSLSKGIYFLKVGFASDAMRFVKN